ncbi:tetratricopeptide repeat protein [Ginsengibacter hankyongi]|uniref:Tetratricopeptide repeat protein n=1 Tax=Ginsengibacter hankyongi TaxID=2607284 RepID=A0A5J5IFA2_9BACT|nr:tetratricopeptide repeat protein [Ginsengibacter hankyongi]KAA9038542.1 tetratricopeptide repeat protein [Ginsengibacter hankyongi]
MASKVPFVKQQINWLSLFPILITLGALCLFFYQFDQKFFWLIALFVYYMLRLLCKFLFFPNAIFEGVKRIKQEQFEQAIPFFEETISYYTKNRWIDTFRFFLLLSSAKSSIMESCLCNLAYCYLQTGDIQKAKEIYQNVLFEYPENINAKSMLNTINLISANVSL